MVSFYCRCSVSCLQFPLLPGWRLLRDAWLELWATGPLDLWVLHFCALDRVREGAALPSPAHLQPQSSSKYTPTCPVPQKSFQVLFEKEKSRKRRNQRLCSSRRSIAWHSTPVSPMTALSWPLLCSWVFPSIYFSFFPFSFGLFVLFSHLYLCLVFIPGFCYFFECDILELIE